jgi:hypothetical protein
MPGRRMTRELRAALIVIALCAAAFVGCFAIGRAERPKSSTGEGLSSSQPTASAGASIPLALRSAPPIDMRVIRIGHSALKRSAGAATKSPFAAGVDSAGARATLSPGTSGTLSAATNTQASAPEVVTPVSSSEHPATTTSPPDAGAGHKHAPAAKTESGASHSFDSSD